MGLSSILSTGGHFAWFVILVVSLSILVREYPKRSGRNKRGFIGFIVVCFVAILINILGGAYSMGIVTSNLVSTSLIILLVLTILLFLATSIRAYDNIDRHLFFSILFFSGPLLFLKIFSSSGGYFPYGANISLALFFVTSILNYFFIVKFLINSASASNSKKHTNVSNKKMVIVFILCLSAVIATIGIVHAVDNFVPDSDELIIYNWEDYFGEDYLIENFEKEHGVNVTVYTFEDEYDMYDELLENPSEFNYDLIIASDDLLGDMIEGGYLYKMNRANIPNLKYLDPRCILGDLSEYSIPYFWGTTGIAFNNKYLPEDTGSWEALWNKAYSGKIGLLNNPSEVIGMASKYAGRGLVPLAKADVDDVRKFLLVQKPIVNGYMSEEDLVDGLISENIWVAQIYDSGARTAAEENDAIEYVLPVEGGAQWIDSFAIPANSENKKVAEEFINYIYEAKVNLEITEYQNAYSCSSESMEALSSDGLPGLSERDLKFFEYFSNYEEVDGISRFKQILWEELINEEM